MAIVELCTAFDGLPDICDKPESDLIHGEPWHDIPDKAEDVDCNYDVDYVGDPLKPVVSCNHHEFTTCLAEAIGADECRCDECIERIISYAEYAYEASIDR